jgi:hypothetical protein
MTPFVIVLAAGLALGTTGARAQSTATTIDMTADASRPAMTRMDKDLATLLRLWPGDYDNREQVQVDADMARKTDADGRHVRVHAAVRHVNLPAIGAHVLYIEDYKNDDARNAFRHGLYRVSANNQNHSLRVEMLGFADEKKWWGAARDPSRLAALTPADVTPTEGCDLTLRRDGDIFVGGTNPETCIVAEGLALDYQVRLADDHIEFRERHLDSRTKAPKAQIAGFAWHRLLRARFFSCMIDPPRTMRVANPQAPGANGYVVSIHDQGGTFTFTHADGRTIFLSLRNTWSYNMSRKTLVVTLQENDESGAGLGYAWSEPGADRLGMNPLWIHIQCDLETPENLDLQRAMRSVL